jgi:hypothetical protein
MRILRPSSRYCPTSPMPHICLLRCAWCTCRILCRPSDGGQCEYLPTRLAAWSARPSCMMMQKVACNTVKAMRMISKRIFSCTTCEPKMWGKSYQKKPTYAASGSTWMGMRGGMQLAVSGPQGEAAEGDLDSDLDSDSTQKHALRRTLPNGANRKKPGQKTELCIP